MHYLKLKTVCNNSNIEPFSKPNPKDFVIQSANYNFYQILV